jgi:hypothetical protein
MVRMYLRIDQFGSKEAIIKHLMVGQNTRYPVTKQHKCVMKHRSILPRFKISKDAWRNIYAEKMEKMINFAMLKVNDGVMPRK